MTLTGPGDLIIINNYLFPFPIYFVCALVGDMSDDASYIYSMTSETSM